VCPHCGHLVLYASLLIEINAYTAMENGLWVLDIQRVLFARTYDGVLGVFQPFVEDGVMGWWLSVR